MAQKTPKRRIMRALKINEISAVDTPAQQGALATIMKRHEPQDDIPDNGQNQVAKRAALTTSVDGHSHIVSLDYGNGEINAGETSYVDGHSHPWVRREDGTIMIGEARGHTHGVAEFGKVDKGELDMTDKTTNKSAEGQAEADRIKDLEAQLAKANAIAGLSGDDRAHYDALDAAGKDAFLAKSADDRKADIQKAAEGKAVVYKAADGTEYTKADDPRLVALAKARDEDRKELQAANKRAAEVELRKRAEGLGHLPGSVDDVMEMLRAIDAIPNEDARKRSLDALTAQNTALSTAFKSVGHNASAPEAGSAEAELDNLAKAYAKDKGVSEAVAYDEVLKTARGQELYEQTVSN